MFHPKKLALLLLIALFAATYAQAQDSAEEYASPPPPREEASYEEIDDTYEEAEATLYRPDIPAQTPPPATRSRSLNEAGWKQLTADDAFNYEEPEPAKPPRHRSGWWARFLTDIVSFFSGGFGNMLIILLVALIVVAIVVRIIQLRGNIFFSRKDKKLETEQPDETSDEYVPESWDKAIQDAAAAGNYRLAVRHCYRFLLQTLQEKELIQFQPARTNYQYAYDLSETRLYQPFLHLTRHYEYAWYGGFPITREGFEAYRSAVQNINKNL